MMHRSDIDAVLRMIAILCMSAWGMVAAPAEDPLQQQSAKQEQIKTSATRVGIQLDQILTEFDLNGISGEDVKILRAIRSVLNRLTDQDMQKVLQLLTDARQNQNSNNQQVSEAFSGQRNIITQLRQLLTEYQRQQAVYDIAIRLKELAARQTDNMRLAVWLARQVDRKALEQFQETQRLNLQLQETDEASIRAETSLVLDQLEKLVTASGDATTAERPRLALERAKQGGMMLALDTALRELKSARMLGAAGSEKRARDQMREVARLLTQSLDKQDALREALRELDAAIDKQQALTDATRKLQNKEEAGKREGEQGEVVDSTDLVRKDIQDLAPAAAEHLQAATDRMQEARSSLLSGQAPQLSREQAIAKQGESLTKMEQARRELLDQLTKAESPKQLPEKALSAIEILQQRVRDLIRKQEQLRKETSVSPADKVAAFAPKQGDIQDDAHETQQLAAEPAPEAAEALGEAAAQMQKSQKSLAEEKNLDSAQQAALEALERAAQALAKQKEHLEEATKELADLEALLKKLIAIIQEQQDVFTLTTREAVKPIPAAMPETVTRQHTLSEATRELGSEAEKPAPKASEYLAEAALYMVQAREQLSKVQPIDAQAKESIALKQLYAARKELERKIDQLKEELGEESEEESDNLQDISQIIAEAQKDVNEALSQLQQGAANAMQTLKDKQQQIATDLAQPMISAPATTQAKREAEMAVQKLTKADLPSALESMKAALGAMERGVKANQPLVTEGAPNLPTISDHQKEVLGLAQALEAAMKNASTAAMDKAAQSLSRAGKKIQPLSSGKMGELPGAAQQELEAAQEELDTGAAEAGEHHGAPAQASAQKAGQHLAQAQAAIALAQSGLSSDSQQQASNSQGQGKKPGQGKTKRSQQGQPGPQGDGREGNWRGNGGADGPTTAATGSSKFTGLPARDRAAIQQSQSESYPQEYAPLVEQYLRNLADQAEPK
ncbi:MAG: hypothetical protein JNN07_03330 [Verrucomicrobiales bacterium]|nr:hypothetical protein [Verrucomicrobiales bacterium]